MAEDSITEFLGITLKDGTEIDCRDEKARVLASEASKKTAQLIEQIENGEINIGGGSAPEVQIDEETLAAIKRNHDQNLQVYEGRDLTEVFAEEIAEFETPWHWIRSRFQEGNTAGIEIGDYIPDRLTDGTEFMALLGMVNGYWMCGDTEIGNHLGFIFAKPFSVTGSFAVNGDHIMWNTTATNNGTASEKHPYLASNLRKWEKEWVWPKMPAAVRQFMIAPRLLLEERYGTSALSDSTSWSWATVEGPFSLCETEVYGQTVWGTKGYSVGMAFQWPIFRNCAAYINGTRVHWWLRSAGSGSSSHACGVYGHGNANRASATHSGICPRPCFLLGF